MVKKDEQAEEQDKPKVFEKLCPYCKKPFFSLSEKQLLFNYTSHVGSCKFKSEKKKKGKESASPSTFLNKKENKR